jgi:hypothetical protein
MMGDEHLWENIRILGQSRSCPLEDLLRSFAHLLSLQDVGKSQEIRSGDRICRWFGSVLLFKET